MKKRGGLTFEDKTILQQADAMKKRYGSTTGNAGPSQKKPKTTIKPILKKDQVGFKVTLKG